MRVVIAGVLAVVVVVAVGVGGAAWYYSSRIYTQALNVDHAPPASNLRVVAVGEGTITLAPLGDGSGTGWKKDGVWGVEWDDGYAVAGAIRQQDDASVTRAFEPRWGTPVEGDLVRLDSFAFPPDAKQALGIDYEVVRHAGPQGDLSAWYVAGSKDTWIVAVHGMGSKPAEALRLLSITAPPGYPMLSINYRNDEGLPASASGRYDYGRSEWEDVEAAVRYAQGRGAQHVVLVGYSMGGGIVMSFMRRSELADSVSGLILDSPMLDFGATIDFASERMGLPGFLTPVAKRASSLRHGVDYADLRYVEDADRLKAPVLLFHGDDDTLVPIGTSEDFATRRPDIVTYVRVPGATHVRSWNVDQARYEAAVREFLGDLTP